MRKKTNKLTVEYIRQWVLNDEGLYDWYRSSKQDIRAFIRENRGELEACINRVLNNDKPAHYLKYGG